jgi:ParB family chromosome partitioning protein
VSNFDKSQTEKSKKGLGRGLGSLLGGIDLEDKKETGLVIEKRVSDKPPVVAPVAAVQAGPIAVQTTTDEQRIWVVGVEKIKPNPTQPRKEFDPERLKELTNSIKEKGILQPIVVRKSALGFEIIAGERRWRAAQAAGLHEVPIIVRKAGDQESLELALIENIQRHDLNAIDESEAYEILVRRFGLTQEQISLKVGKERSTITNSLRLLGLGTEVKQLLRNGTLSAGHAKALLSIDDPKKQLELAKKIINMHLSVRAAEGLVKNALGVKTEAEAQIGQEVSQRLVKSLSEELQKILGTKVRINYAKGEGEIAISFYSDAELTQTVERLRESWKK